MSNSSGISACVMSSEYFTRTSLYLVRLKIFEWIKFLRRHLHQIQENGTGRNFITASRVNSGLITRAREINLKSTTTDGVNFRIINSSLKSDNPPLLKTCLNYLSAFNYILRGLRIKAFSVFVKKV